MFEVYEGKDKELAEKSKFLESLALSLGLATKEIYLSGGSDTRRSTRDFWKQWAYIHNIPFKCEGNCKIVLGEIRIDNAN